MGALDLPAIARARADLRARVAEAGSAANNVKRMQAKN